MQLTHVLQPAPGTIGRFGHQDQQPRFGHSGFRKGRNGSAQRPTIWPLGRGTDAWQPCYYPHPELRLRHFVRRREGTDREGPSPGLYHGTAHSGECIRRRPQSNPQILQSLQLYINCTQVTTNIRARTKSNGHSHSSASNRITLVCSHYFVSCQKDAAASTAANHDARGSPPR